jgi:hypothetical protein
MQKTVCLLRISAKRKRFCTARELKNDLQLATVTTVSTDTIRRRLSEAEIKPYRPATGPVLSAAHRRACLQFAHRHADSKHTLQSPKATLPTLYYHPCSLMGAIIRFLCWIMRVQKRSQHDYMDIHCPLKESPFSDSSLKEVFFLCIMACTYNFIVELM